MLADKWGRRIIIVSTLILYGIATGLSGLSIGLVMLLILRFFVGIGLRGELPTASTLVAELSPAKMRGKMVVLLESFWAWGWILAALISYLVIPVYGWRVAFFLGAIPALYAAYLRGAIPESPRYLELVGREREAEEIPNYMERAAGIKSLEEAVTTPSTANTGSMTLTQLLSGLYLRRTLCLWILWVGINFGYYGFVIWVPTLMVGKGYVLIKSFQYSLIMSLAQLPGYFSAASFIEVIGRKPVLVIYLLGTALEAIFRPKHLRRSNIGMWVLFVFFQPGRMGSRVRLYARNVSDHGQRERSRLGCSVWPGRGDRCPLCCGGDLPILWQSNRIRHHFWHPYRGLCRPCPIGVYSWRGNQRQDA
jgi:putative MFS transporter